ITLTSGELVITNNLTISGPGATNLTVSGNNASRVFYFNNVTAAISGLTVSSGRISTTGGAGINNSGGSLIISNCIVTENVNDSFSGDYGGGIFNNGDLTVVNSTVSNNRGSSNGGGICNWYGSPSLKVIDTTIAGNSAGEGGGLWDGSVSTLITNTTISGNTGRAEMWKYGGTTWLFNSTVSPNTKMDISIVVTAGSTLHIFNSILAGRLGVNPIGSTAISHDFNLIQNTNEAAITGVTTHNIYGKDPLLGPLADNGGPTKTHALLPGSPAIDHGSSGGLTTDQRGQPRIFNFPAYVDADDGSDIGAYELQERAQTGPVITVNSNDDVDDGVPGIAHCSLREAINAANANPGTNTINFATGVPSLMTGVTGTIVLTNGQLSLGGWGGHDISITGPGAANLTISGNNTSRVFDKSYITSVISGLTIADGNTGGLGNGDGAGVNNAGGTMVLSECVVSNCVSGSGGGVRNVDNSEGSAGYLTLVRCTITQNASYQGGGVANYAHLFMSGCTLCSNVSYRYGGGLFNGWSAWLTNCTISGNTLAGEAVAGGGIYGDYSHVNGGSDLLLVNCTVCSNGWSNSQSAGGIFSANPLSPIRLQSTLIAGNSAIASPDCAGPFASLDFNLIQNTNGCVITGTNTHDIYNQDPKLGPLADLGGPTLTHALRFDSPAIDAGSSGGLTTDQRGLPRPIDSPDIANAEGGDGSDIGAYEADPNLRITGFGKTGEDIWLSFNSMFGRTYRVESTDQLPPAWNVLTNNVPGTGGRFQILDGGAATLPQRFYRTVLLP
ncbi:MAG: CSLREA domain-containing protein, partial [Verrucomicrobia bacterium]|nr:CSLREA domain-containing protein [Verrucomicrobiota bacterium]